MSRDNLVSRQIQLYKYLFPDVKEDDVVRLGHGTAMWLWNNRAKKQVHYLERTFVKCSDPFPKEVENAAHTKPPAKRSKKEKSAVPKNIPTTREEFMAIPAMKGLFSVDLPPAGDDEPEDNGPEERDEMM